MNPVYAPILVGIIQFIGTIIFLAWKKGQDDAKLETLRTAHNKLSDEVIEIRDTNTGLQNDLANIRGWLKGSSGSPLNGGTR